MMLARWFGLTVTLIGIVSCAVTAPFRDDSHYVPLGPRTGYYVVRPGSQLYHQLGVEAAPVADTSDPFRHGYGTDALVFQFNRAGILAAPPIYIVQATPNDFYLRRLGSLIRGRSTQEDVQIFFGRPRSTEEKPEGLRTYYAIEVYNPFDDRSGGGRR